MYADWGSISVRVGEAHVLNMHLAPAVFQHSGPVVANLGAVPGLLFLKIVDVTLDHIGAP